MNARQHRKAHRNYIERNKQQIQMLLMNLLLLGPTFSTYEFAKASPYFVGILEYFYWPLKLIEMVPHHFDEWRISQKGKDLLR